MRLNVLISFFGVCSGIISGVLFAIWSPFNIVAQIIPGFIFGCAVAVIYILSKEGDEWSKYFKKILAIAIAGSVSYLISHLLTLSFGFIIGSYEILSVAPVCALIGGGTGTVFFIWRLKTITDQFAGSYEQFALWGGLLGAFLIDMIFLPSISVTRGIIGTEIPYGQYVFFIVWQTTMLFLINESFRKRTE